jgi:glycosyltransferase involved in cell wall biosynthesis
MVGHDNSMHIFHVITTINKGGAESHLVDLCRALADRGIRSTVCYLKGDGHWASAFESMGVETIALNIARYFDPAAMGQLRREIKARCPDIVHAHMPPAELYAVLALRGYNDVPLITSKHNDTEPFYRGPGARWLERICAARASRVIAISQAVQDYFANVWPDRLSRQIEVVRYGLSPLPLGSIDQDVIRALRHDWGVCDGEVLFGIVARLVPQKSIDTLLRAFALVRSANRDARLVIVGAGPLEEDLRALANSLDLGDAVIWAGFRRDIAVVMRALDVFVLSSIYEGFGLVLLEAMEASRPIVASRVSAIPEIVVDGETGRLVSPRNPRALAAAMAQMMERETRLSMGARGHRRLLDTFVVERMAQETAAIYEEAIAANSDVYARRAT